MNIEQIIKKEGKVELYNYYLGLGYEHKVAASLALFTYGEYSFNSVSIDDLYEALCRGFEYLPPEEVEMRRQQKSSMRSAPMGSMRPCRSLAAPSGIPNGLPRTHGAATKSASTGIIEKCLRIPDFLTRNLDSEDLYFCDLDGCGSADDEEDCTTDVEDFATDDYECIEEKDARSTVAEPTSTFRMTTNTASVGVILNQLRNGRRIDKSMVRIEEMLNYFRYQSEIPEKEMFNISYEIMDAENGKKYLYINVQGREEVNDRQNIIVLLDVSGSMGGNAEQTQAMVATIVSKLGNGDKISLVTYSSEDHVELDAFTINSAEDRIRVLEKLLSIEITGGTYGSKGIEQAYQIGKKNFIDGGNNQVILITDGDLNFGITDKGGLEELIELKKKENIFLSVIGTGLYNYKDDKLEVLSKHGNGVYRTVNNIADVKKSVDEEYISLVNIIAKDVKAQVEFNPAVVESYRLLGFENRGLAREDFANDKVISEPFGSGGYGIALYEITMNEETDPIDSGLKYSSIVTNSSQEPCTIKVRYKEPLADVSHELEKVVDSPDESYTDNIKLAFIVYVCAEKLRGSDKISKKEIKLAKKLYKELGSKAREDNAADLFKLAGILEKSEKELGIGIPKVAFPW